VLKKEELPIQDLRGIGMDNNFKTLNRNNIFYNYFLEKKILKVRNTISKDELLERIILLSKFSWRNHSGYYFDGRLENILFDYGRNLDRYVDKKRVDSYVVKIFTEKMDCTILHVATQLYEVGGHTRVLYQFLKRHKDRKQILVLTDQTGEVPKWFIDGLGVSVKILTLDSVLSLCDRAYVLRHISTFCNAIILYHHPCDVVPVMAFADDKCPPVLIENHAHSWFWLGPSIADLVFSHTKFHQEFTRKVRPVSNSYYLQGIQNEDLVGKFNLRDKVDARKKLKLGHDDVCLIAIGTYDKFIPNSQYNFYKTAKKILDRFKNVELFVVGISESTYLRNKYHLDSRRIHFVGVVSDPTIYYLASDICLDALPQPSLGATLYSTLIGMSCPLFKYGKVNMFNTRKFLGAKLYDKYVGDSSCEGEYLNKLEFLIDNPKVRIEIANEIRGDYMRTHSSDVFIDNIYKMLDFTKEMKHQPVKISDGICHYDDDSAEIAAASYYQDLSSVINHFDEYLSVSDRIIVVSLLSSKSVSLKDIVLYGWAILKEMIVKIRDVFCELFLRVLRHE
jgi:hypothetical protein